MIIPCKDSANEWNNKTNTKFCYFISECNPLLSKDSVNERNNKTIVIYECNIFSLICCGV